MKNIVKKTWFKVISVILVIFLISQVCIYVKFFKKMKPEILSGDTAHTYRVYELDLTNDGKKIYGVAYVPDDIEGEIPTVIMSHGYGANADTWKETAESFAMSGIACFAYDFCGGNDLGRSDGSMAEMSIMTEKEDLLHVIEQIKKEDFVDKSRLFLMGESQGGLVSAIAAAEVTDEIAGLILYYPAFGIEAGAKEYASVDEIPEKIKLMRHTVGKIYYEDMYDFDTYETIAGYTGRVLIIHGTSDPIIDISASEKAQEVYENVTFIPLKGEQHGFSAKGELKAAHIVYDFLQAI